jgi:hypothetical protein
MNLIISIIAGILALIFSQDQWHNWIVSWFLAIFFGAIVYVLCSGGEHKGASDSFDVFDLD